MTATINDISSNNIPSNDISSLATNFRITPETEINQFTSWLAKLMLAGAKFPGFWSGEIIPPESPEQQQWTLVQRFSTTQQADAWRQSEIRNNILAELRAIPHGAKINVSDTTAPEQFVGNVIAAIETHVRPEMVSAYWEWERKIQSVQARYPGYRGSYLQPPAPSRESHWVSMLRFDSPENLANWFNSDERKILLAEADQFVHATNIKVHTSSFPGWFPTNQVTGEHPPAWKTAILVILGLYPVLMLQRRFLLPLLAGINTAVAVAFTTTMTVCIITGITMPILVKSFAWWLLPEKQERAKINIAGCLTAACILALEIALLWNLLPIMPRT